MKFVLAGLVPVIALTGCKVDVKPPAAPPTAAVAEFDPLGSPPRIPLPNDLAFTGGDGMHLNITDRDTDSAPQKAFNAFLRGLEGFPSASTATASFTLAIDAATVKAGTPTDNGSVFVFDTQALQPLGPTEYRAALTSDGKVLEITPTRRWRSGGSFVVILFGGDDPVGLKGAMGEAVISAAAFFFLKSPSPVLGKCGDGTGDCACPVEIVNTGMDPGKVCRSVITGLATEQALRLEGGRRRLSASLDLLLPFAGSGPVDGHRRREDVALMWNFTITPQPMGVFDPTRSEIPFPNDALLDQTTGRVNLPVVSGDPMAMLNLGLNQLDGFSSTGAPTMSIDSVDMVDAATLIPNRTVFLLNATDSSNQPEFTAAPVMVNGGMTWTGQIAIVPKFALDSDNQRYVAVVTSDVKDRMGRPLQPAVPIVAARNPDPIVDENGKSLISSLSDANATQLERLRSAFAAAGLFGSLERNFMVTRDKVSMVWAFTTESVVRPLNALEEYPTTAALSTNVTIDKIANQAELTAKASMLPFPVGNVGAMVLGRFTTRNVADPLTQTMSFDRTVVNAMDRRQDRFVLRTPAGASDEQVAFVLATPRSAGPWPVVMLQHGLRGYRGDIMPVVDRFAQAGWASISVDAFLHGARARCTDDAQCVSTAAGSCNRSTGVCAGGLKPATVTATDPLACSLQALTGSTNECRPIASGAAFIDVANLFATRDHGRQFVLDSAQAIRVLKDTTNVLGLYHQLIPSSLAAYDPARLGFLGQSLGGIGGAIFLAVAPEPTVGVLNVTGGHDFEMLADGGAKTTVDAYLAQIMVQRDTAAYNQVVMVARWVLDPIDPIAVGSRISRLPIINYRTGTRNATKAVILQEAGMDTTIPPKYQEALALEILGSAGLDAMGHAQGRTTGSTFGSTYFPMAVHGAINAVPATTETTSMQNQAATWISSSGATLTAP